MVKVVLANVFYISMTCKYQPMLPQNFIEFVSDEKIGMVTLYGANDKSIWFHAHSGYYRFDLDGKYELFNVQNDILEDMCKNKVLHPVNFKSISWDTEKPFRIKVSSVETR